jgi:hypothetical protein
LDFAIVGVGARLTQAVGQLSVATTGDESLQRLPLSLLILYGLAVHTHGDKLA